MHGCREFAESTNKKYFSLYSGNFVYLIVLALYYISMSTNVQPTVSPITQPNMEPDDSYFLPSEDQRVFGAGLKRKRVQFVPAAPSEPPLLAPSATPSRNTSERYLSIVFPSAHHDSTHTSVVRPNIAEAAPTPICHICNLPLDSDPPTSPAASKPHESSLVHQLCLAHSHPPSHLDRARQGLKYLSSYGWDPDSRLGLGAKGEGIRAPLKGAVKNDTVGLGVKKGLKMGQAGGERVVRRLDAKGVRRKDDEDRKRGERLREMFYGNPDVDRYMCLGLSR